MQGAQDGLFVAGAVAAGPAVPTPIVVPPTLRFHHAVFSAPLPYTTAGALPIAVVAQSDMLREWYTCNDTLLHVWSYAVPLAAIHQILCALPFLSHPQLRDDPLSTPPDDLPDRRRLLHTLTSVFLPLVPSITRPEYCIKPLWACAETNYGWAGGATALPLAEALLGRLGEDGCAMLRRARPKDHVNLWYSLSTARNATAVAAQQGQLLAASAECMAGMGARDVAPWDCAEVLRACERLRLSPAHAPLVHHLTRCLAEQPDPDAQALAGALYALGELHRQCGHVPHREDLDRLLGAVVRLLRDEQQTAGEFADYELSAMLYACAELGVEDGEVVQLLAAAARAAGR